MTVFGGSKREVEVIFQAGDTVACLEAFDQNVVVSDSGITLCSHDACWYFIPMSRVHIIQEKPSD